MYVLGIAGTAKNTGKTTTTMALLAAAEKVGHQVALTSIGYDGENLDNVTGLPKPRITMVEGSLVVTAKKCIPWGTAKLEVVEPLDDIRIPLGKMCIAKVIEAGTVVIAGPNKGSHLTKVIEKIAGYGADVFIVDGALNRIAPMVRTQGIILATGAARNTDIERLALETGSLDTILNLPKAVGIIAETVKQDGIAIISKQGREEYLTINSLAAASVSEQLAKKIEADTKTIIIPGVVDYGSFKRFLDICGEKLSGKTLIVQDSIKILVGGSPIEVSQAIKHANDLGFAIRVVNRLPLLLITFNPFYPAYSFTDQSYSSAFVDKYKLEEALNLELRVPAVDVMKTSVDQIYLELLKKLDKRDLETAAI